MASRAQGLSLMTALCTFIAVMLVIQLWLVAAALDALLAGDTGVLVPAAAASAVLFVLNLAMLGYAFDFDRRLRSTVRPGD